jgi:hypothetical protein
MNTTISKSSITASDFIIRLNSSSEYNPTSLEDVIATFRDNTISPLYHLLGETIKNTIILDPEFCNENELNYNGDFIYLASFDDIVKPIEIWVKRDSPLVKTLDDLIEKNLNSDAYLSLLTQQYA